VNANFFRLWFAGAVGNSMRWLEMLVAGIFTYGLTRSTIAVALVTVARTLPMLFIGVFAGVVSEALNRKRLLLAQLLVMGTSSAVLCVLAESGRIGVWHIAVAGVIGGVVWASEMSVRRRMIGEVVAPPLVGPVIAFDSLTGSCARMVGPLAGGAIYQMLGIGGAYMLSAALYSAAFLVVLGLEFEQTVRRLRFSTIPRDIAEGLKAARDIRAVRAVVYVTIICNTFGFSYSALVAPIGIDHFGVSPLWVGALAAGEPLGAIASGIVLSAGLLRMRGERSLLRGSFMFFVALVIFALSPWYGLALMILVVGGLGTAAFGIMQTTLILTEAPQALRSRVLGVVTMCIGTGPLGVLAVGFLSASLGPATAILIMAGIGLAGLAVTGWWLARSVHFRIGAPAE
jgi:MFS family permease